MLDKDKREQRRQQEDAAFNKMLLWLAVAVAVELLFLQVRGMYVDFSAGLTAFLVLGRVFQVFSFLGAALTAAGVAWVVLSWRRGKSIIVPCICAAVVAGLWVLCVFGYVLDEFGLSIMVLLPIAGAVLIVVYFLYQRVFFCNTLLTVAGLMVLWLHRQYFVGHPNAIRLFFAAEFALLAAGLALSLLLRRDGGKLRGLQVMPPDTDYLMTWITCALTALALVLTLALGPAVGFYLLFALAAWVFVQAVFYTVQLM